MGVLLANKRQTKVIEQFNADASSLTEAKIRAEAKVDELKERESQLEEAFTSKASKILAETSEKSKGSHSNELKKIVDRFEFLEKEMQVTKASKGVKESN